MTSSELHGLRAIVLYLHSLPPTRKNVPDLLANPVALIHDVRTLVEQHRSDQAALAVTGTAVIGPAPASKSNKKFVSSGSVAESPQPGSSQEQQLIQKQHQRDHQQQQQQNVRPPVNVKVANVKLAAVSVKLEPVQQLDVKVAKISSPFPHLQTQLKQQMEETNKKLRQATCVVRPANVGPANARAELASASALLLGSRTKDLILRAEILTPVFHYLPISDLLVCMRVCRSWNRCSIDSSLWKRINLSHKQLTPIILAGIIRRQTQTLILDWSSLSSQQLTWLLDRLPR